MLAGLKEQFLSRNSLLVHDVMRHLLRLLQDHPSRDQPPSDFLSGRPPSVHMHPLLLPLFHHQSRSGLRTRKHRGQRWTHSHTDIHGEQLSRHQRVEKYFRKSEKAKSSSPCWAIVNLSLKAEYIGFASLTKCKRCVPVVTSDDSDSDDHRRSPPLQ